MVCEPGQTDSKQINRKIRTVMSRVLQRMNTGGDNGGWGWGEDI